MTTSGVNKGWLRRVFGTMELEPGASAALAGSEQTKKDLEELLDAAARRVEESDAAQACVDALDRKLGDALAEAEILREARAVAEARVAALEAQSQDLGRELQRSMAAQVDAQRKAEVRGLELDKVRKSVKALEQQRSDLYERCARVTSDAERQTQESKTLREKVELAERVVSALKAELERARKRTDQAVVADQLLESVRAELEKARADVSALEPLRHANEALELSLAAANTEAARGREVILALQQSAESQLSRLVELERRDEAARGVEVTLQAARRELLATVSLCARALDATLGDRAHLALEVAFREQGLAALGESDHDAAISGLRGHLTELGLASSCQLEVNDDELIGRMSLGGSLSDGDSIAVARWLAAYATEWLNRETHADRRLQELEGVPGGIVWKATARSVERRD